eukprot:12045082-Alexandrium_andersonii.AAC.1
MAQDIGLPQRCVDATGRLSDTGASWRSAVVGDSTLAMVANKSNAECPEHALSTPASEALRNEPSIYA